LVNRAVDILKRDVRDSGIVEEEVKLKHDEAVKNKDWDGAMVYDKILRPFRDARNLPLVIFNSETGSGEFLNYSEKAQAIFLDLVDPKDIEVVAEILGDNRFSNRFELIRRMDESTLQSAYDHIKNTNLWIAGEFVDGSNDKDFKIRVLREISEKIDDPGTVSVIKMRIGKFLIQNGFEKDFFDLCDSGLLDTNLGIYLKSIRSNEILFEIAKRSKYPFDVLRCVSDPAIFAKIIETQAKDFTFENERARDALIPRVRGLKHALENEPIIVGVGEIEDRNKFIVTLPIFDPHGVDDQQLSEQSRYFIAWGGLRSGGGTHKSILASLKEEHPHLSDSITVGGYISIDNRDDKVIVVFNNHSGDFGYYDLNIVEKFRPQIEKALKDSLGKEVEVTMESSS